MGHALRVFLPNHKNLFLVVYRLWVENIIQKPKKVNEKVLRKRIARRVEKGKQIKVCLPMERSIGCKK